MFTLFCAFRFQEGKPQSIFSFPPASSDELKSLAAFGYPCPIPDNKVTELIQYFRLDKPRRWVLYTHCCRINVCICIAGRHPYFSLYRSILGEIRNQLLNESHELIHHVFYSSIFMEYLHALFIETISSEIKWVNLPSLQGDETFRRQPLQMLLKPLDMDKETWLDFVVLSEEVLTHIYFWTLMGGRQYLFSKNPKRICNSVIGTTHLIRPLKYLELVINLLPSADYLQSPLPCIFGVTEDMFKQVEQQKLLDDGYLAIDLDVNECYTMGESAIDCVPPQLFEFLLQELRNVNKSWRQCKSTPATISGSALLESYAEAICRAFFTTTVAVLCGYENACSKDRDGNLTISRQSFASCFHHKLPNSDSFYNELYGKSHTQQFLQKRLAHLNKGKPLRDEFEEACRKFVIEELSRITVKKTHGGVPWKRIAGHGRDAIHDFANKTVPVLINGVSQIQRKTKMHRDKNAVSKPDLGIEQRTHSKSDQRSKNIRALPTPSTASLPSTNMRRSDSMDSMLLDAPPAFCLASKDIMRASSTANLRNLHETSALFPTSDLAPPIQPLATYQVPLNRTRKAEFSHSNEAPLIDLDFDSFEPANQQPKPLRIPSVFLVDAAPVKSTATSRKTSVSSTNKSENIPSITPAVSQSPLDSNLAVSAGEVTTRNWVTFNEQPSYQPSIVFPRKAVWPPNTSSEPETRPVAYSPIIAKQWETKEKALKLNDKPNQTSRWPPEKPNLPPKPKVTLQELIDLNLSEIQLSAATKSSSPKPFYPL